MESLTHRQQKAFDYIDKKISTGFCPTQRQIAAHLGISQNAALQLVGYLKAKGYLESRSGHRNLQFSREYLKQKSIAQRIPVVGCACTGINSDKPSKPVKRFINSGNLFNKIAGVFFVRAEGNGMCSAGILDGDYVLIKPGQEISDGLVSLLIWQKKMWLKKAFAVEGRTVFGSMEKEVLSDKCPVVLEQNQVEVVGRMVGSVRLG